MGIVSKVMQWTESQSAHFSRIPTPTYRNVVYFGHLRAGVGEFGVFSRLHIAP